MKGLTERQREILDFVEEFSETVGMAPTVYEIAGHFRIKTSTVFAHLHALQKKKFLHRSSKARSISLDHPRRRNRRPAGLRTVPMDGPGALFPDGCRDEIFCDALMLGGDPASNVKDLFARQVHGNALREHGILDGDIAILKRMPERIRQGDVVLAEINGLPEFRSCSIMENGKILFSTDDPGKKALVCPSGELPLKGVVIGIQRAMPKYEI